MWGFNGRLIKKGRDFGFVLMLSVVGYEDHFFFF